MTASPGPIGQWRELRSVSGFSDDEDFAIAVLNPPASVQIAHGLDDSSNQVHFVLVFINDLGDPILDDAGKYDARLLEVFLIRDVNGVLVEPQKKMIAASTVRTNLKGFQKIVAEDFAGSDSLFILITGIVAPEGAVGYQVFYREGRA